MREKGRGERGEGRGERGEGRGERGGYLKFLRAFALLTDHKLYVVDDDVANVMYVHRIIHCIKHLVDL